MKNHKRPLPPIPPVWRGNFGVATPDIEAEVILMTARLWKRMGVAHMVQLELNTLGEKKSVRNIVMLWLRS